MRSSISLAVLAAVATPALSVTTYQPVSQISDGQIQAPPATSAASSASSAVTVVPTSAVAASSNSIPIVSPSVVSSVASIAPVVSSAPVVAPSYPTGNTSVPVTIPTYTNTTLASVSVGSLTATAPAGTTAGAAGTTAGAASGTSAAASATRTGAADVAFGSPLGALSYLAVAVAGFFLA